MSIQQSFYNLPGELHYNILLNLNPVDAINYLNVISYIHPQLLNPDNTCYILYMQYLKEKYGLTNDKSLINYLQLINDLNDIIEFLKTCDKHLYIKIDNVNQLLKKQDITFIELIKPIPDTFKRLNNLIKLGISSSGLTSVNNSICNITNLRILDLSYNNLTTLPDELIMLNNLVRLYLQNNKLKELPDNFGNFKKLRELDLSFNRLKILPDSFGNLTRLYKLDLYGNILETLPENFKNMISLVVLDIQCNNITVLPDNFEKLVNLDDFTYDSKITNLPKPINLQSSYHNTFIR